MKYIFVAWLLVFQLRANAQVVEAVPDSAAPSTTAPFVAAPLQAVPYGPFANKSVRPFMHKAALVAVGAGVWTATFALVDEPLQQFSQSHQCAVADAISKVVEPLGHSAYLTPVAVAALAGGLVLKDQKLEKLGAVSLGSILVSAGVTSTLKDTFHRHRPSSTTENHLFDGPITEQENKSLPSAHTTAAFAMATSLATVYSDRQYVAPIAYGVATLVGMSRINDNAHWATDVMAGAAIGYLSAKGVNYLYDIVDQKMTTRRQRLLLTPQLSLRSGSLNATLIF
ncbi:phosphatase PAP2 family protein [Pontibacter chitinilyticus]|uniref:phosphatase PAP2 family protein n=1 Tax=Pontibacter chitinilyticus TaxID=2674989 RepID=UPI00321990F9